MSRLAEFIAIEEFDWIVEADAYDHQIIADTLAE